MRMHDIVCTNEDMIIKSQLTYNQSRNSSFALLSMLSLETWVTLVSFDSVLTLIAWDTSRSRLSGESCLMNVGILNTRCTSNKKGGENLQIMYVFCVPVSPCFPFSPLSPLGPSKETPGNPLPPGSP